VTILIYIKGLIGPKPGEEGDLPDEEPEPGSKGV